MRVITEMGDVGSVKDRVLTPSFAQKLWKNTKNNSKNTNNLLKYPDFIQNICVFYRKNPVFAHFSAWIPHFRAEIADFHIKNTGISPFEVESTGIIDEKFSNYPHPWSIWRKNLTKNFYPHLLHADRKSTQKIFLSPFLRIYDADFHEKNIPIRIQEWRESEHKKTSRD